MVNFGELHLPNLSRNNVGELQLPNPLTNNLCFSWIRAVVVTELAVVDSGSLLKKTFAHFCSEFQPGVGPCRVNSNRTSKFG